MNLSITASFIVQTGRQYRTPTSVKEISGHKFTKWLTSCDRHTVLGNQAERVNTGAWTLLESSLPDFLIWRATSHHPIRCSDSYTCNDYSLTPAPVFTWRWSVNNFRTVCWAFYLQRFRISENTLPFQEARQWYVGSIFQELSRRNSSISQVYRGHFELSLSFSPIFRHLLLFVNSFVWAAKFGRCYLSKCSLPDFIGSKKVFENASAHANEINCWFLINLRTCARRFLKRAVHVTHCSTKTKIRQ